MKKEYKKKIKKTIKMDLSEDLKMSLLNSYFVMIYITRNMLELLKVGLSPSKNICIVCLIESPLQVMKNAFYFILKAFFVLKIFTFLSRLFEHV